MVTLNEVKEYLKIDDTGNDTIIEQLIPSCVEEVITYTNNFFDTALIYSDSLTFAYQNESSYITTAYNVSDVEVGDFILVDWTKFNDGLYQVLAKNNNELRVNKRVKSEDGAGVIKLVTFPLAIKYDFIKFIEWHLGRKGVFENNESLPGGYSVSYKDKRKIMYELFGAYRVC